MKNVLTTDVLVVGGGLAGERCAIEAACAGNSVILLSLVPPRRSHSCAAQGGMQAALGNCVKAHGDNPDVHFLDTVRGSDWGADQEVVRIFVDQAPVAVRELAHYGVPWTRVRPGKNSYFIRGRRVELEEPEDKAGLLMHRDFGGTAMWRTCYAAAGTGHAVLYAVDSEVLRLGIDVRDRIEAIALVHQDGHCWGAVTRCLRTGQVGAVLSKATVIATGGYGRIYGQYTTNAVINEGTGIAIALDTGVVPLANLEAVQFHPTALVPSGILVTEGCRGDGGYILDRDLHRFLVEAEPEKQELASRDVVSRHMMKRIQDGKGVDSAYGPHLWLDLRHLGEEHLKTKLLEVFEICQDFIGVDPVRELIPVRPTQHYSMGGIRVNKDGQAYGLKGLFAVGESACWDMHGFNRLGGNSLAETIVAGRVIGGRVAEYARAASLEASVGIAEEFMQRERARIGAWLERGGSGPTVYQIREAIAEIMINKVGIFRVGHELEEAVKALEEQYRLVGKAVLRCRQPGLNPELTAALRLRGIAKLALGTALGALARTESRGAHYRTDYPRRDDASWLKRTLARWPEDAHAPSLSYESVGLIDLPPGHRGYGGDNRMDMTQSIEEYNDGVMESWRGQGAAPTVDSVGSAMRWGAWRDAQRSASPGSSAR
jgi:fumarate reductase flavoprotein subunit